MKVRNIFIMLIIGFIILFTTQNTSSVAITFFFFNWNIPLIILLYIVLLGGFFCGYFYATLKAMKKNKKNKADAKEISDKNSSEDSSGPLSVFKSKKDKQT